MNRYLIPAESLDARIALNLTLFLALTALQFVVNEFLPASSTPTSIGKLVLTCYCAVVYGVPETLVVFAVARSSKVKEEMSPRARQTSSLKDVDEDAPEDAMHGNMSLAMKVMKRKKTDKPAFIVDMVSFVIVSVTLIVATILVLVGL